MTPEEPKEWRVSVDARFVPRIETFKRSDSLYDWRLVAGNGEVICSSFQGYTSETDAKRGAGTAMELLKDPNLTIRSV